MDCANQQPGSTTITVSGSTTAGVLSGQLSSPHVICSPGTSVVVHALAQLGSSSVLVIVAMQAHSVTIAGVGGYFKAPDAAATISATGGHVSGDFTEQGVPAASAHTVHVSGDAVCGSSVAL